MCLPRKRRLCCYVCGKKTKPDKAVKRTLLRALTDKADGVRWQGATALRHARWGDAEVFEALGKCVADENDFVAVAAVRALVAVKAPEAGKVLTNRLAGLRGPFDMWEGQKTYDEMRQAIMDTADYSWSSEMAVLPRDEWRVRKDGDLKRTLMEQLGRLGYEPTVEELERWLAYPTCEWALEALGRLDPAGQRKRFMSLMGKPEGEVAVNALAKQSPADLEAVLLKVALDAKAHPRARSRAMSHLAVRGSQATARRLATLLGDETVVLIHSDESRYRICHAASAAIAGIEGWSGLFDEQHTVELLDEQLARARKWAASQPAPVTAEATDR